MKRGVLGGTFDPIHNGHLAVAEEVRRRLGLGEIIFIPAGIPWHRDNGPVAEARHRLAMVRLAINGEPGFKLSTLEIERKGPSYSVNTVTELRKRFGGGDELFLILGWDNLAELPRWREPSRLVGLCSLVAVPRLDYPPPCLESLEADVPGLAGRVILLDEPRVDISASEVRELASRGLPVGHLVPEAVAAYIREQGLYAGSNRK